MQPATHFPSSPDPQTNKVFRVEALANRLMQSSGSPTMYKNGGMGALQ